MACLPLVAEDNSLDDAELWDFIDSTIARRSSYKPHPKPLLIAHHAPIVTELPPSPQIHSDASEQRKFSKGLKRQPPFKPDSVMSFKDASPPARSCLVPAYKVEAASDDSPSTLKQRSWIQPQKIPRREEESPVSEYRLDRAIESRGSMQRSHTSTRFPLNQIIPRDSNLPSSHELIEKPRGSKGWHDSSESGLVAGNSLPVNDWMPSVPSAAMFKHIQNAALSVLEKGDYVLMQGKPFIKKCGWRKIAFFFNISFEIKDRTIQFDQSNNVQRAEFVVRANMQSGRFSDGWGSCDRGEKRYSKPNHDIPSTAETRAKTRACQDLLGIGEYKGCGSGF
eukprot:c15031_g1_i1 orf=319-1329(-)